MDIAVTSGPASEPLTLQEAKDHLRLTEADDDALIAGMITSARTVAETFTRLAFIQRTITATMSGFPCYGGIVLPVWPLISVDSVKYDDETGVEQTLDPSIYIVRSDRKPREIWPSYTESWPSTRSEFNSVRVEATIGFGSDGSSVPGDLIAAMKLILGDLYEQRENTVIGASTASIPTTSKHLMLPHVLHF